MCVTVWVLRYKNKKKRGSGNNRVYRNLKTGPNRPRFRTLEYDRIPAPDSIYYSELHRYVVLYGIKLYLCLLQMDAAAELGRNPVSMHHIQPEYGDEQADAGRDG